MRAVLLHVLLICLCLTACQKEEQEYKPYDGGDAPVYFSLPSGAYDGSSRKLYLSNDYGLPVYYTTDGSIPSADSNVYSGPIKLKKQSMSKRIEEAAGLMDIWRFTINPSEGRFPEATVIRAASLLPDGTFGPVSTATYFIGTDLKEKYGCAVISLAADPDGLLDNDKGILVRGALYDMNSDDNESEIRQGRFDKIVSNYMCKGREWEREAYLQIFDDSNALSAESPCGIRLKGRYSRVYGQRSFNLYFREDYGQEELEYRLIPGNKDINGQEIDSYKSFSLRNGGNDTEQLKFKDSAFMKLLDNGSFCVQKSRPAVLFINGEYYGVINLQEKYSDDYIESHFGTDAGNVIIIEEGEVEEGEEEDIRYYEELTRFSEMDLADEAVWREFLDKVDLDSMAGYYAAQIYIGNCDFDEITNCRLWRSREYDGTPYGDTKWRWMLYDTENSSGMYGEENTSAGYDDLDEALRNCPLFASAMKNGDFRKAFADALTDLENRGLEYGRVSECFDGMYNEWSMYYDDYFARFGHDPYIMPEQALESTEEFFRDRPGYINGFLEKDCGLKY